MNNTSEKNKICAVIPFFNEKRTLKEIITRTLPFVDFVIAVNDGSTDNPHDEIPKNEKVILLSYPQNRGKGYALKKGFEESIKRVSDITITLDADLQHMPEKIPELISGLKNYDVVVGNRLNNLKKMPFQRVISNKLTSFLLSIKTKQKLLDTQSGYRAYKTRILNDILPSYAGFEAESEMLVNAAEKNYKINFVPIPTIYAGENSKMRSLQAIAGFIKVLLK
ncbi:MAG: glycosyltransferase family 2 protein [Ignavibacteriaceae bacterium]|nr:glycosyltransferase family 2 protein [Ignavibacteriaceae bacterium]